MWERSRSKNEVIGGTVQQIHLMVQKSGTWEISPGKWASIRQPHWHRHLDVKRPYRALEQLSQVVVTRAERQLLDRIAIPELSRVRGTINNETIARNCTAAFGDQPRSRS